MCSGRAYEIGEVLRGLIAESGLQVDVEVAPELLRPVDQPLLLGSFAKLERATGWMPEIPIDRTLRDIRQRQRGGEPIAIRFGRRRRDEAGSRRSVFRERRLHSLAEQEGPTTDKHDVLQTLRCFDPLAHR